MLHHLYHLGAVHPSPDRAGVPISHESGMLERLEPSNIIFMGIVPDGCKGKITPIAAFQESLRTRADPARVLK